MADIFNIYVVTGADPFNSVILNTTKEYLNGQQINNINNLTQEAINNAQQATQQGGGSGGGGGNPTSSGVSAFNGNQNFSEHSDYIKQAIKEQVETNFQRLLDYFNTDPIIQSILNEGKNSPYLSEVSPEIAEQIAKSCKESYDFACKVKQLESDGTTLDYTQLLIDKGGIITDHYNNIDTILGLIKGTEFTLGGAGIGVLVDYIGLGLSMESVAKACHDFDKKYPDAYKEAWQEVGGFNFNDLIPPTKLLDKYTDVQLIARYNNPDLYDKRMLTQIDLAKGLMSFSGGVACLFLGLALAPEIATGLAIGAVGGLIFSGFCNLWGAAAKTSYLKNMRPSEQSENQIFLEQLFGVGFGGSLENEYNAIKNWFKGNDNPSSSQNVVESTSNTSPRNLLKSASPLTIDVTENAVIYGEANASAATTGLLFSGSAGNDTLFNVEDNYLIDAGAGDD